MDKIDDLEEQHGQINMKSQVSELLSFDGYIHAPLRLVSFCSITQTF